MGWLERCYETYEKNLTEVGKSAMHGDKEAPMLLPVAHTTQKVQAEISLSAEGSFLSARVVRPDEATTVIPCTEGSSSRTSGPVPHPLVDKLQYIAGDYTAYGGKKKSEYRAYVRHTALLLLPEAVGARLHGTAMEREPAHRRRAPAA